MDKHNCSQRVYGTGMASFRGHGCTRNATVERDGQWFCKQHDPVAVAEKEAKKRADWDAQWKRSQGIEARAKARAAILGVGQPDWSPISKTFTGGLRLSAAECEILIAKLEAAGVK